MVTVHDTGKEEILLRIILHRNRLRPMSNSIRLTLKKTLLFGVLTLIGCSTHEPTEDRIIGRSGMKVSVYSGGKQVTNPNRELVHRVTVKESSFDKCRQLFSAPDKWMQGEPDSNGGLAGGRVTSFSATEFGLQRGDLLMSVNKTHLSKLSDVSGFCPTLLSSKKINMSVIRNNETHEIYVYME